MILGCFYNLLLLVVTMAYLILSFRQSFRAQNYFFIYLLMTLFVEFTSLALYYINPEIKVGLLYNLYLGTSVAFFAFFYGRIFTKTLRQISLSLFLICLIFQMFFTKIFTYEFDYKLAISAMIYNVINSLLWYWQKINSAEIDKITNDPHFWISSGLLLWSSFTIFRIVPMFILSEFDEGFHKILINILHIINIIMYGMFYIALEKFKRISSKK